MNSTDIKLLSYIKEHYQESTFEDWLFDNLSDVKGLFWHGYFDESIIKLYNNQVIVLKKNRCPINEATELSLKHSVKISLILHPRFWIATILGLGLIILIMFI